MGLPSRRKLHLEHETITAVARQRVSSHSPLRAARDPGFAQWIIPYTWHRSEQDSEWTTYSTNTVCVSMSVCVCWHSWVLCRTKLYFDAHRIMAVSLIKETTRFHCFGLCCSVRLLNQRLLMSLLMGSTITGQSETQLLQGLCPGRNQQTGRALVKATAKSGIHLFGNKSSQQVPC